MSQFDTIISIRGCYPVNSYSLRSLDQTRFSHLRFMGGKGLKLRHSCRSKSFCILFLHFLYYAFVNKQTNRVVLHQLKSCGWCYIVFPKGTNRYPHNSIPFIYFGLVVDLCKRVLFESERGKGMISFSKTATYFFFF